MMRKRARHLSDRIIYCVSFRVQPFPIEKRPSIEKSRFDPLILPPLFHPESSFFGRADGLRRPSSLSLIPPSPPPHNVQGWKCFKHPESSVTKSFPRTLLPGPGRKWHCRTCISPPLPIAGISSDPRASRSTYGSHLLPTGIRGWVCGTEQYPTSCRLHWYGCGLVVVKLVGDGHRGTHRCYLELGRAASDRVLQGKGQGRAHSAAGNGEGMSGIRHLLIPHPICSWGAVSTLAMLSEPYLDLWC